MKINKKGFTLIELLAVIAILGILLTLAYVGVSQYLTRARNAVYEDFENNIETGAANYLIDHTGYIPDIGETVTFDVNKLINEGYIEELEDPSDTSKNCNDESYAIITRKEDTASNMDIDYSACLVCSNYKSEACSD